MEKLQILSRSEMRKIRGGNDQINPEFPGIECVDDNTGSVIKSTCYSAGCAYGKSWCPSGTTCNDITDC